MFNFSVQYPYIIYHTVHEKYYLYLSVEVVILIYYQILVTKL